MLPLPAYVMLLLLSQADLFSPEDDAILLSPPEPVQDTASVDSEVAGGLQDAISKLALEKNEQAKKLLRRNKYPEALALFREAYELDSKNAEIANNFGFVYALLGNVEEARKYYEESIVIDPTRAVVYLNYSDLLSQSAPEDEKQLANAAALLVKARELMGNNPKVILRQARLEVLRGRLVQAERFYREYLTQRTPTEKLKLELGDFFRDMGNSAEAVQWYEAVEDPSVKPLADGRLWELEVAEQSVRMGWQAADVTPQAERLAQNAAKLFNSRKYREAEQLYQQVLRSAPTYADAMAGYGDVLYRTGRVREAETFWLRALVIDRDNPTFYAKLAQLYLAHRNRAQATWAVVFLTRALELRPQWIDLELDLAVALRETGDPLGALSHVKNFLNGVGIASQKRQEALKLKRALETLIPPEDLIDSGLEDGPDLEGQKMSAELAESLRRAKAHLKRGNLNGAMAELRSLSESDRGPAVLNLEARILLGAGKTREAQKVLIQSLQKNERQPIIHEQLGLAYIEMGHRQKGRIHLERAEQMGYTGATYLLAQLDAGELDDDLVSIFTDLPRIRDLVLARRRLNSFLANDSASIYGSEARALNERLNGRFDAYNSLAALALFSILLLGLIVYTRIWGGTDLRRLISKYPDAGIQVQRVLSAVRHEVLKHNTMMLVGLVEAIDGGEDATLRVSHFSRQILGEDGNAGVRARLQHYINELRQIGDAHKKRLNLKRKDAVTAPLLKGMQLIGKNRSRMQQYASLSYGARAALKRDLKMASSLLNIEGYEALRDLLNQLRTLTVNEELLRSIYNQCKMEPAFAGVRFAEVQVSMDVAAENGLNVAVPRAAFVDIVTNLIRNAIQSSVLYCENADAVEIGLAINTEVDMVTGIERVVLLVKDKSPRELTAEMLRGRYIEEGLGLTADLVTRYDGTLDVFEGDSHFVKSVAVKLPVATYGDDT